MCVFCFYCKYEVSNQDIHISIYLPVYYRYLSTFNNPSIYLPTYLSSNLFGESSTSNLNLHPMSSVKLFLAWSVHLSILEVPWEWAIYLSICLSICLHLHVHLSTLGALLWEGSIYPSVFLSICLYTCVYLEVVWWTSIYASTCLFVGGGLLWLIYLYTSLYILQLVLWCSMYTPIYQSTYAHLQWGCYQRSVSSYPSI